MKSKKIIIIIIVCVLTIIGGVTAAFFLKGSTLKTVQVKNVSEAFEIAKKNGFEGVEEDWRKIVVTDNDTNQKGIAKVYVDADKHLIIEMENGTVIDAGDANVAVKELIKQNKESAKDTGNTSKPNNSSDGKKEKEQSKESKSSSIEETEKNGNNSSEVDDLTENDSMPSLDSEQVIFTVVFKDDDGTVLKTENVIIGKSATAPVEPKKEGYRFDGWDKSFTYVQEDLVVTAIYKKSTSPTISLSSVTVKSNEKTAKVNVDIANNPGIASLVLDINYPKEIKLKDVEFNQNNLKGAMSTSAKPFSNPQRISIINSTKEIKTNGTFATLTFELPKDLKSDYSGSIIATYNAENVFDIDMNNVQFETINGKILISK